MSGETKDAFQELRDNKTDLAQLFESRGWAILVKWTEEQTRANFERAIRAATPEERDAARIEGLTMEKFVRLAVFLADNAGISSAEGAVVQSEQPTPDAP